MTLSVLFVEVFCHPLPVGDQTGASTVIDADNCSSSRQVLGTECHVTCLPGYQLQHQADVYTCQYEGRALWYPETSPVCIGKLTWCDSRCHVKHGGSSVVGTSTKLFYAVSG